MLRRELPAAEMTARSHQKKKVALQGRQVRSDQRKCVSRDIEQVDHDARADVDEGQDSHRIHDIVPFRQQWFPTIKLTK